HADAGVADVQAAVFAKGGRAARQSSLLGQLDARRLNPQHSAVRHGVARVGGEVEEDLLDGMHVRADLRQADAAGDHDLDVGGEDAPQQPGQIRHEPAQVRRLEVEARAAGEAEQLLHHHAAAQRRRHDVAQVGVRVAALGGERLRDELGVRQYDRQQVVEVVREPARELADRLHFLRLAQLLLQRPPLRDVLGDRLEALDPAVGAPHRRNAATARCRSVTSVPTPITPLTGPATLSRIGENHASNTVPNTSTVEDNVSPASARRTSASAWGRSAYSSYTDRPTSWPGRKPSASSPRPSTIVKMPCWSNANSTSGAPAITVRSRSLL